MSRFQTSTTKSATVQEKNKIWREEAILNNDGRNILTSQILTLSDQWKKHRGEAKERTSVAVDNVENGEESEGEVELVESEHDKKSKRRRSGPAARVRG